MDPIEIEYPNFYNSDLPAFVCCTGQYCENNQENLKQAFMRICSKYFYVKNVKICKGINNSRCQARVTYRMKDDNGLPLEPDLKLHVSFLLKHAPLNAVIIQEQTLLQLPKDVIVPYEIFCKCPMKYFDQAADPSQMQPLIKQFQDLQTDVFEQLLEHLSEKEKVVIRLCQELVKKNYEIKLQQKESEFKEKESEFKLKETKYKCEISIIKNKLSVVNWESLKNANLLDIRSFIDFFDRRYFDSDTGPIYRSDRFTECVRNYPHILKEWDLDPGKFKDIFQRLYHKLCTAAHIFFYFDKALIIEQQQLQDMELRIIGLLWEIFPLPPQKLLLKICDTNLKPLFDMKKN